MSVSNYRNDHDALQARVEEQQQEAIAAKNWLDFVRRHPEVRLGGLANESIFKAYFASDYPGNFTLDALEEAYQNPALRKQLALDDPDGTGERAKSLETIERITGSIPVTAPYASNEELANRAAELERRRELNKKSPEELRQIIRAGQLQVTEDDLPAHMDRAYLLGLTEPGTFKKIVKRFGSKAVTKRLNQR